MGNWRTVDMKGYINQADVASIRDYLSDDETCKKAWCFAIGYPSICGLNNWINDDGSIDISANLYERDFDNDDIEEALKELANKYPSLTLTLHSGSDYESIVCSATFHVANGVVHRCDPEVKTIRNCRCLPIMEYLRLEQSYQERT